MADLGYNVVSKHVRISERDNERLTELEKRKGRRQATLIREAVEAYLDREERRIRRAES
jgi:predicted DNA-binding protein